MATRFVTGNSFNAWAIIFFLATPSFCLSIFYQALKNIFTTMCLLVQSSLAHVEYLHHVKCSLISSANIWRHEVFCLCQGCQTSSTCYVHLCTYTLQVNNPITNHSHVHKARDIDISIRRELISLITQLSCTWDLAYLATNYLDKFWANQGISQPKLWGWRLLTAWGGVCFWSTPSDLGNLSSLQGIAYLSRAWLLEFSLFGIVHTVQKWQSSLPQFSLSAIVGHHPLLMVILSDRSLSLSSTVGCHLSLMIIFSVIIYCCLPLLATICRWWQSSWTDSS